VKPYFAHDGIAIYHGDCEDVLSVLPPPRVVITDPPYGISYSTKNLGAVSGDHEVPTEWLRLIRKRAGQAMRLYWFVHESGIGVVRQAVLDDGWALHRMLVWDKGVMTPGDLSDYGAQTEYIISAVDAGKKDRLRGARDSNLISVPRVDMRVLQHPTEKPVPLMSYLVVRSSDVGDLVLDPFMGSGPVLVAAQQLGRRAIGIEREEKYCEIAAKRLAQGALPLEFTA